MNFLDELNHEQRQAVEAGEGPVAIVAGPGTGKTKTLTSHIAYLLEQEQVHPREILALTFTNKAAKEMRERLRSLTPKTPGVTTFHALCYDLLQKDQAAPLHIIPELDRLQLLRTLKVDHGLKSASVRELSLRLTQAKNTPLSATSADEAIAKLLTTYNDALRAQNLYDFDDLLQQVHERLLSDQAFSQLVRNRFSHILVDEFQDTNTLQYELLKAINRTDNLFVIGDPLQSIYGFRGASAEVFERFKHDWPAHKHVVLHTNYRSTHAIVTLANAIFPDAPSLQPYKDNGGTVHCVEVLNEYCEATFIINEIETRLGGTSFERSHHIDHGSEAACTFKDFAVIYRTHHTGAALQRAFSESGIPYQIAGDGSPYEKPYVQDVLKIMRYFVERSDESRSGILKSARSLSASQLDTLLAKLPSDATPSVLATSIAETYGILTEDSAELRTFKQFINSLVQFDNLTVQECLARLDALAEEQFYDPHADAVTLLTIHAAKGLEFEQVFLVGAEEGILPHKRRQQTLTPEEVAEERRLFYVATTRAKSALHILHARSRGKKDSTISPFLTELGDTLTRAIDPALAEQQRLRQKHQRKRAQTSLF